MDRKIVLLALVLILFSLSIVTQFTVQVKAQPNTIYVDASNIDDPLENGSLGHPFDKIQEGINAASSGETVFVYDGTYYEHVNVNKTVSLIGEKPVTTVIDGSRTGRVVSVNALGVEIKGFTIQNGGLGMADCGILMNRTESTISNNIIRKNYNGLELLASNSSKIVDNIIIDNSYAGIFIHENAPTIIGGNNRIFGNTITYNIVGAWIASSTINNTFYHNNFINNTEQILCYVPTTRWDNGTEGNFWSDYTGEDNGSGGRVAGDGIGDTEIPHLGIDNYPLMSPWGDIAFPVADAGPDQTVYEGVTVTFDGSGSTDDVGIKSYVWAFKDVTPKNLTGVRPTYRFKNVGNFTVTLNVTDYSDKWATDTMWVNVTADPTKPSIGIVSQDPPVPDEWEKVTITVNVTDGESGVLNVTLWYSINEGATWTDVPMNKPTGDTYVGEIPGLPAGTNVTYKIIAYDNAENFAVKPEAGYYIYTVIPEFPAAIILPLFIVVTLVVATLRRSKKRTPSEL